ARRPGGRGEGDAERVLRDAGYVIEARQVTARYALDVDGGAEEVLVRADFLARRGAARYVADAKGGERASRITDRATRRQLIEYLHAYDVDGALLVDATRGEVTVVRLGSRPARVGPRGWGFVAPFALGVSIGALVAFVVGSAAG
ncbi:MAG: hypothetical protein KF901_33695, partial [Myxococcales bacterium]|nr:hypothetical protein [Myxococcales bacterium]